MPSFRVAECASLLVHLDREQQTKFGIPIFVERFPGFLAAAQLAGGAADCETKKTGTSWRICLRKGGGNAYQDGVPEKEVLGAALSEPRGKMMFDEDERVRTFSQSLTMSFMRVLWQHN